MQKKQADNLERFVRDVLSLVQKTETLGAPIKFQYRLNGIEKGATSVRFDIFYHNYSKVLMAVVQLWSINNEYEKALEHFINQARDTGFFFINSDQGEWHVEYTSSSNLFHRGTN